ncbi:MAG: sugar transferase [Desulfomicrobium sp.]
MSEYALSPVVLFVYARPEHTKKTVDALVANDLASETDLIIYSDAPRAFNDFLAVQQVRTYIQTIVGFRSVTIYERDRNFGLADSIISGVTDVVKLYGKVIVLEDDLVVSPFFLRYMNDALRIYENNASVMHVSGHIFDIDMSGLPESFFLPIASCWGWGTWARSWECFSNDSMRLVKNFRHTDIFRFNLYGSYNYWAQVLDNHFGRKKTWAVFWYASIFEANGLCLHPRSSLVENIGFDGSGSNCGKMSIELYPAKLASIASFPVVLGVEQIALHRYRRYLCEKLYLGLRYKVWRIGFNLWHKFICLKCRLFL